MRENSELMVITKAKDLIAYLLEVTENAPKKYRFSLTGKMHSVSLDVLENLILANELRLDDSERYAYQKNAIAKIKVLDALALIAKQNRCILPKQYEVLTRHISDCIKLTGAWINSDKKRLQSAGIRL